MALLNYYGAVTSLFNRAGWAGVLSLLFPFTRQAGMIQVPKTKGPRSLHLYPVEYTRRGSPASGRIPQGEPLPAGWASITAWASSMSKKDTNIPGNKAISELGQKSHKTM